MSVNGALTPTSRQGGRYKRPRRYTETVDFIAMVGRMVKAASRRVGAADMDELQALLDLRDEVDDAIGVAVRAVRENGGYSWSSIGEAAGMSKQAAQQKWGRRGAQS